MNEVIEGNLKFTFPAAWSVVKYDAAAGFAERRVTIQETKRVDILALDPQGCLLIIEIKDFRGFASAVGRRLNPAGPDPLHLEIAHKVRDTISIMLAAFRSRDDELRPICDHLFGGRDRRVDVILFFEEDEPRTRTARGYRDRGAVEHRIRELIRPYAFGCHVQRRRTMPADAPWSVEGIRP